MNKSIYSKQINKDPPVLQSSSTKVNSYYKIPQPVASKTKINEINALDYKNISLTLTGEISSDNIYRNNLTHKQPNTSFVDNMEDDDEQFILNMKRNIDKNYKMQNKENYTVRDLQSKSYSSRKKKSVFSEEDQNLMKRFKKSVDENKALCVTSQKLQHSKNVNSNNNHSYSIATSTPKVTPVVSLNNIDMNLINNANEFLFHITSEMQKNDQLITPNTRTITETEIEQLIYYEMQYFTPPNNL